MARSPVATIDPTRPIVTLINVYEVAKEKQAELAQMLADATDNVMRRQAGFVSANIHSSVDGT
jgi:Antibiotic biosynthesis monooxygenase